MLGAGRCPSIGSNPKQHTSAVPQSCLISRQKLLLRIARLWCALDGRNQITPGKYPFFFLSLQGIMENSFTYLHTDKWGGGRGKTFLVEKREKVRTEVHDPIPQVTTLEGYLHQK